MGQAVYPMLAQSTTGLTLGNHSLAVTQPGGGVSSNYFWGPTTGNLASQGFLAAMTTAQRLSYDLTLIGSDLFTGDNPPSFAQGNEIAILISWNSGGALTTNGSTFIQKNSVTGNATDSLMATQNSVGQWNGVDGARTITWDLSKFTVRIAGFNGGAATPFQQFIQQFATQITDLKIQFAEQVGDNSSDSTPYTDNNPNYIPFYGDPIDEAPPATFFYDNVRLIPEPASIGGLALLSLLALHRRR